jgi:copper chaperone CopZ
VSVSRPFIGGNLLTDTMSNRHHHHPENECCAHDAALTDKALNPSAVGNLQTTLQVAEVDCAEEVSMIQRALKPLRGVREVRVNIMSGKAIIAHDETITPEVLIKVIGDAGLKRYAKAKKLVTKPSRDKNRDFYPSASRVYSLSSVCWCIGIPLVSHKKSFSRRFGRVEWIATQRIKFPPHPAPAPVPRTNANLSTGPRSEPLKKRST